MSGERTNEDQIADPHVKDKVEPQLMELDFNVKALETVTLEGPPALMERDYMSPFVWREKDGRWGIMVRAVCKSEDDMVDTGVIWGGWSDDGQHFTMLDKPLIEPGPDDDDIGGIEDPTVVQMEDGSYVVYYSGVEADQQHGELCYAAGPSIDRLEKKGVALKSSKTQANTKEATVYHAPDGKWWLLYEYAADEASRIGLAVGDDIAGPWEEQPTPFMPREDSWDNWHLSTGPVLVREGLGAVMFYNGATRDARWRIGWVAVDATSHEVVARGIEPLITPPPGEDRGDTDIAFAASAVEVDGKIWLYYSLQDSRLGRALLRYG